MRAIAAAGSRLGVALILLCLGGSLLSAQSQLEQANELNKRAIDLHRLGRTSEAIELAEQAVQAFEKVLPVDDPRIGTSLNNLALLYNSQGRLTEAEKLYVRAQAIKEKALPPTHPEIAMGLNNLASVIQAQGRLSEARSLYLRSDELQRKTPPADFRSRAMVLNNLASLYNEQGQLADAERLLKEAIEVRQSAATPDALGMAVNLNNLASLYSDQGRFDEAEALYRQSLELREKNLPAVHVAIARGLNNLAQLYQARARFSEAEPLYKRALEISEKALPAGHAEIATNLNNLANLYREQGRMIEAEPLFGRSLEIVEKAFPPGHPTIAMSLNNLAVLYQGLNRPDEAAKLLQQALEIRERSLPPGHPMIAATLNNMAVLYLSNGQVAESRPLFQRALELREQALPAGHPEIAQGLGNLASYFATVEDWPAAHANLTRSTDISIARARRGGLSEAGPAASNFRGVVKVAYRTAKQDARRMADLSNDAFMRAQWAIGSEAAGSIAQMSVRGAAGDPGLAAMVRERQDLFSEWQELDKSLVLASARAPESRSVEAEQATRERIARIDARMAEIDRKLAADFPDFASLARPEPLSIADTQSHLAPNEALVLILGTRAANRMPEEAYIWVITKTEVRWLRSDYGLTSLAREVAALRCGLDLSAWYGNGAERCAASLNLRTDQAPNESASLPFDAGRAHTLYQKLFGEAVDLIKGRDLLIVLSGALTSLPLHVLVTEKPADTLHAGESGYDKVAWLGTQHALSVLPAVSSLRALRRYARRSAAANPYIGFGNPLIAGRLGTDTRAWERQRCPALTTKERLRILLSRVTPTFGSLFRGGLADVKELNRQEPLPETTDELCAVASASGITDPDAVVNVGKRATEARVKALSADGTLSRARVVHFATHGFLAGETAQLARNRAEPSLLLTPPETASEVDDGLLTASEVAGLKLDADWAILSACNTAAGDVVGGDALSGLARGFFFAGARALLASHWYVDSDATVTLVAKSFGALKEDPKIGRAEALRRAMTDLVAGGGRTSHPAIWSPFVLVGEGGAAR